MEINYRMNKTNEANHSLASKQEQMHFTTTPAWKLSHHQSIIYAPLITSKCKICTYQSLLMKVQVQN